MTDNFNPKITYRMIGMNLGSTTKPWEYLQNWSMSDRGYDPDEMKTINEYMQKRYPGPYKIVKKLSPQGRFTYYEMEFNSPQEETMYRLKWA